MLLGRYLCRYHHRPPSTHHAPQDSQLAALSTPVKTTHHHASSSPDDMMFSCVRKRVLARTFLLRAHPPLDFDYNDGVSSDPVDFDDHDDYYGATSVNHGDDDADNDTSTQPLRADETGVTVGRSPSWKTEENYTRRTRRLRTSQQRRWRGGDR